jgi:hypothetical protein
MRKVDKMPRQLVRLIENKCTLPPYGRKRQEKVADCWLVYFLESQVRRSHEGVQRSDKKLQL